MNGVGESAYAGREREGTIAHRLHLCEPARLKAAGYEREIRGGEELMSPPEVKAYVDLNRVRRIGRDILLNEKSIRDYLAEVGPVPFSEEFRLKAAIEEVFDKENVSVPTFQIYLNDEENAITRPFRELIEYNDTKHWNSHRHYHD